MVQTGQRSSVVEWSSLEADSRVVGEFGNPIGACAKYIKREWENIGLFFAAQQQLRRKLRLVARLVMAVAAVAMCMCCTLLGSAAEPICYEFCSFAVSHPSGERGGY